MLLRSLLGTCSAVALATIYAQAATFPSMPASATLVSDNELSAVRGKYVPPGDRHAPLLAASATSGDLAASGVVRAAGSNAASPLANVATPQGGTVTYFGIQMISTWTSGTGATASTESVGMTVGINAGSHALSVHQWSMGTGAGIPADTNGNAVNGPALSNLSSGVGQSVQIAGNGNSATNEATVTFGAGMTLTPVPVLNTCGTQCSAVVAPNQLMVSIVTPRGTATQSLGNGLIAQSIQAWGNANAITNQLGIAVRTAPAAAAPNSGLSTILPTLTTLP